VAAEGQQLLEVAEAEERECYELGAEEEGEVSS